jgi:hypothetical protein
VNNLSRQLCKTRPIFFEAWLSVKCQSFYISCNFKWSFLLNFIFYLIRFS